MKLTRKNPLQAKACALVAISIALVTMAVSKAAADDVRVFDKRVSGVPAANPEVITDNVLSPEFTPGLVAEGIDRLENPSGLITRFGNLSDDSRTEPDENTYLILDHNPGGPTPDYDYGRHFLFQGHENSGNRAHVTRINLDVAHPDHRITLLTPLDANGLTEFNSIDGSTWDPFSRTLLLLRKPAITAVSSRWAPISIRTPEGAPVCAHSMAASGAAVTKAFILMTGATS
jgi:hypothetical protein